MGNRAIITLEDNKSKKHPVALYVHWNGGLESVLAMIEYTWETFAQGRDDLYTFHARLCQVIGNFFPDGLSLYGLPLGQVRRWEGGLDNGVHHFKIAPEGFSYLTAPDRVVEARTHEYWRRPQPIKATLHSAMPRKDEKYNHVGGVVVDSEAIPDNLQLVGSKSAGAPRRRWGNRRTAAGCGACEPQGQAGQATGRARCR